LTLTRKIELNDKDEGSKRPRRIILARRSANHKQRVIHSPTGSRPRKNKERLSYKTRKYSRRAMISGKKKLDLERLKL
jgi:hypothetical protein